MPNLNKVFLIGHLTRDPEMSFTPGGTALAKFGMAINRKWKEKEETCFVDVKAWGKTGELVHQYLKKGRACFVEGRLEYQQWEQNGQKRSKLEVVVDGVQFLGGGGGKGEGEPPQKPEQLAKGSEFPAPVAETGGEEEEAPF